MVCFLTQQTQNQNYDAENDVNALKLRYFAGFVWHFLKFEDGRFKKSQILLRNIEFAAADQ